MPPEEVERRAVLVLRTVVRGAVDVLLRAVGAVVAATPARSAAVILSSGV
ncbi:MAG TPA: hypothetical protein VGJ47_03790 [Gemmatimonadaceae bacterium]